MTLADKIQVGALTLLTAAMVAGCSGKEATSVSELVAISTPTQPPAAAPTPVQKPRLFLKKGSISIDVISHSGVVKPVRVTLNDILGGQPGQPLFSSFNDMPFYSGNKGDRQ